MSFLNRLRNAWSALLGKTSAEGADEEELLELRRDLAAARMEAQEAREALEAERSRREGIEAGQEDAVRERVESELEEMFERLAAPLSQLRMQAGLMEDGKDVDAQDVMTLGRKLADAIEEAGLEPVGSPGGTMEFDPDLARPLGAGPDMERGDAVVVKFVGYRYAGRVIRKALVAGEE